MASDECTCKPDQGYHDRMCPQWENPYTPEEENVYNDMMEDPPNE